MIRIAVSLAAYQAIASSLPKGHETRPPEPLEVGEGVGLWIDRKTQTALDGERRAGEGYSEVILRLCSQAALAEEAGPLEVDAGAPWRGKFRRGDLQTHFRFWLW